MKPRAKTVPMNFKTLLQSDVPQGRNGKHRQIVQKILSDLDQMSAGTALRVPLDELAEGKERVRSALSRATHKAGRIVVTSSDPKFLYIWNKG